MWLQTFIQSSVCMTTTKALLRTAAWYGLSVLLNLPLTEQLFPVSGFLYHLQTPVAGCLGCMREATCCGSSWVGCEPWLRTEFPQGRPVTLSEGSVVSQGLDGKVNVGQPEITVARPCGPHNTILLWSQHPNTHHTTNFSPLPVLLLPRHLPSALLWLCLVV